MILSFEIAKKLKEAGFKYSLNLHKAYKADGTLRTLGDPDGGEFIYIPLLDDLIEAIREMNHDWNVYIEVRREEVSWAEVRDFGILVMQESGPTPSDAVATLWLALKNKYHD